MIDLSKSEARAGIVGVGLLLLAIVLAVVSALSPGGWGLIFGILSAGSGVVGVMLISMVVGYWIDSGE